MVISIMPTPIESRVELLVTQGAGKVKGFYVLRFDVPGEVGPVVCAVFAETTDPAVSSRDLLHVS